MSELVPEEIAEARAHRNLEQRAIRPRSRGEKSIPAGKLDHLGALVGRQPVTFRWDELGEWEARTLDGEVGRGGTLRAAIDDLALVLTF